MTGLAASASSTMTPSTALSGSTSGSTSSLASGQISVLSPTPTSASPVTYPDVGKKTGLGAGVGIGIGIGTGVSVFAITAIVFAFVTRRRRRTRKNQIQRQEKHDGMAMPELSGIDFAELEDHKRHHEAPATLREQHRSIDGHSRTYGLRKPELDGMSTTNRQIDTTIQEAPAASTPRNEEARGGF